MIGTFILFLVSFGHFGFGMYYIVFLPNEYFESISRLNMLLSGCILMVCWSIMYVEIYRLTKSVWPCVIMHAIEDAVPTVLVTITGIITLTNSSDFWLNPISGVVATVLFLGIGIVLRTIRIKRERQLFITKKADNEFVIICFPILKLPYYIFDT